MAEQRYQISSAAEAIAKAARITGFDARPNATSAERAVITQDPTPYLWRQSIGKRAWRVTLDDLSLQLKSAIADFADAYRRKFIVFFDEQSGQLLNIMSEYEGDAPEMRPMPSGEEAEEQLEAEEEIYHGLPSNDPRINFLDALDVVLTRGIGSPFLAKEIYGVYVIHSRMGSAPQPVWAITLRGLPPFQARGRYGDTIPVWQRNHLRNVINAMTGEFLFATNSPQPES